MKSEAEVRSGGKNSYVAVCRYHTEANLSSFMKSYPILLSDLLSMIVVVRAVSEI